MVYDLWLEGGTHIGSSFTKLYVFLTKSFVVESKLHVFLTKSFVVVESKLHVFLTKSFICS
jgi:hypothetical protein